VKLTTPLALLAMVPLSEPGLLSAPFTESMLSGPAGALTVTSTSALAIGSPAELRNVAVMVGPAVLVTPVVLVTAKVLELEEKVDGQSPAKNAVPSGLPRPEASSYPGPALY
jgi:hypothetical protein